MRKSLDYIAYSIDAISAIFLWRNISYFAVPDPDIFQYVYDGRYYARGQFPPSIQTPPLNSLLIAALSSLLVSYEYPEIIAAHTINAFATVISLLLLYHIGKKYSPWIGIASTIAMITTPTVLFSSLNINTEVLFTTFVLLTIFFYQRKRITLATIIASLSFLVRYEGLLLTGTVLIIDLLHVKKIKRTFRFASIAVIPIASWVSIIFQRNYLGTLTGNAYIQEIFQYQQNIPQLPFFILTNYPESPVCA